MSIKGNTVGSNKPRADWAQNDETKADYIKNKPDSLLRDGTTAMTADLPMGGFKVTGVGAPTEDGDAVNLGYVNGNFAPSGYGFGENKTLDAPNNIAGNVKKGAFLPHPVMCPTMAFGAVSIFR